MDASALKASVDDLRIVLLGRTGHGKSASGNTILGRDEFEVDMSSESVTNQCQKETATIKGRLITVVDTPGLFDTSCPNDEIKDEITRCMDMAAPGPHVFLLVIACGRYSEEVVNAFKIIQEMFGEEFVKYTIVLFTRGDNLSQTLHEYLKDAQRDLSTLLSQCGKRCHLFNNKDKSYKKQVPKLLAKIYDMLEANRGGCYTTEMFQREEKRRRRRKGKLKESAEQGERKKHEKEEEEREHLSGGEKLHRVERPVSPVPSVMSMESRMSNNQPLNFTEQEATEAPAGQELCDVCSDPAVKKCLTCMDSYCMTHVKDHYTSPDLEGHQLQGLQLRSLCDQHHKKLKLYCNTDQSAICSLCLLSNHSGHNVIMLEKTDQNMKEPCKLTKNRGVPPPGSIQFSSVQPKSVIVSWSPPEGALDSYKYRVSWKQGKKQYCMVVADREVEVTGLLPAENYDFTVSTLTEHDLKSPCVEASVYTEVPMPENLTVTTPGDSLRWTKPEGVDEVSYLVELFSISSGRKLKSIHTTADNYSISKISKPGKEIAVHVSTLKNERQSKPAIKNFTGGLRIVLLGKTGSGKSASGNTIFGRGVFTEDFSTNLVTKKCQKETDVVNDRRITVVDTPGLFDTAFDDEEAEREIRRGIEMAAPGPHVFLLVIPLGRYTEEMKYAVERIQVMFGKEAVKYTIVVFTKGDFLKQQTLDEYLNNDPVVKELLGQYGNRYHSFNNRDKNNTNQVPNLLDKIDNMLKVNGGKHCPSGMLQEAEKAPLTEHLIDEHGHIRRIRSITDPSDRGEESPGPATPVSPAVPELRLMLLGGSAAEKRAVENMILGTPTHTETWHIESRQGEVAGRRVTIVDAPDWFCSGLSEDIKVHLPALRPHVFLLVIPVKLPEGEDREVLDKMEDILGEGCWGHTLILFTHTEGQRERTVEDLLKTASQELQQLVEKCSYRCHLLNIERSPDDTKIIQLIEEVEAMVSKSKEAGKELRERKETEMKCKHDMELDKSLNKIQGKIKKRENTFRALERKLSYLEGQLQNEKNTEKRIELVRQQKEEKEKLRISKEERESLQMEFETKKREIEETIKRKMEMRDNYDREARALMNTILPEVKVLPESPRGGVISLSALLGAVIVIMLAIWLNFSASYCRT